MPVTEGNRIVREKSLLSGGLSLNRWRVPGGPASTLSCIQMRGLYCSKTSAERLGVDMSLPGFTAEASLCQTSRSYQARAARRNRGGEERVVFQLSINRFDGMRSAGIWSDIGGWLCRFWCNSAYSVCLDGCEGTLDNPKPSLNCVICDEQHGECLKACG